MIFILIQNYFMLYFANVQFAIRTDRRVDTHCFHEHLTEVTMKKFKQLFSLLLCCLLALSMGMTALAKQKDEDEEEDYSVSDVAFDVSDDRILVIWSVGDSKCSYSVQLYSSKDFKAKNKVGNTETVGYNAEQADVTEKILKKGSGTYYVVVTCKKRARGQDYASMWAKETIYSEDLSLIREKRKSEDFKNSRESEKSSASQQTGSSSAGNNSPKGPGIPAGGWQQLSDGHWIYLNADGTRRTGWYELSGKWYCSDQEGIMLSSAWMKSESESGVWYYLGADGAMLVDATTPDGYSVDVTGKYKE